MIGVYSFIMILFFEKKEKKVKNVITYPSHYDIFFIPAQVKYVYYYCLYGAVFVDTFNPEPTSSLIISCAFSNFSP